MAKKTTRTPSSDTLCAVVSPRSVGAHSLFATPEPLGSANVDQVCSEARDVQATVRELSNLGFEVTGFSEATVSISGSAKLFEKVFNVKLGVEKTESIAGQSTDFLAAEGRSAAEALAAPGDLGDLIEGVALAIPPTFFAGESPLPPVIESPPAPYRYFFAPNEIAMLLRAARVHRVGTTGSGIHVAMPDSGFYRHPFYSWYGYRSTAALLGAGATGAASDSVGHGTGEAANVFAAAPDANLVPVKMGDAVDSFRQARQWTRPANDKTHIITNSWGWDIDRGAITWATLPAYFKALAAEIQLAINAGIVVCFSAGNGHFAFPASMPDVIAVGGVHVNYPGLGLEASSYSSSFVSKIFPGRRVPDVCGLVGKAVTHTGNKFAPSLMLPVEKGSQLDGVWPSTASDGWGLFSGTSAACPQVAGVAALMLERTPTLTPAEVKQKLISTARDVSAGSSAMGDAAGAGPDLATGAGLVDAKWAWIQAFGTMATEFFAAPAERQLSLLQGGHIPQLPPGFMTDLMESLRTR